MSARNMIKLIVFTTQYFPIDDSLIFLSLYVKIYGMIIKLT